MFTIISILSSFAPLAYTPLFPNFEGELLRRNFKLTRADYVAMKSSADGHFDFRSSDPKTPEYSLAVELSPKEADRFADLLENVQVVYRPLDISIPKSRSIEACFGGLGGGSIRIVVPHAYFILTERPLTALGSKGLKVTEKRSRSDTVSSLKTLASLLIPEAIEVGKSWKWRSGRITMRYPE